MEFHGPLSVMEIGADIIFHRIPWNPIPSGKVS